MNRLIFVSLVGLLLSACVGASRTEADVLSTLPPNGQDAGDPGETADAGSGGDAGVPCTPLAERTNWPVRVLFVIENAVRMCVIDPPGSQASGGICDALSQLGTATTPGRIRAVQQFYSESASRPNVAAAETWFSLEQPGAQTFGAVAAGTPQVLFGLQSTLGKASDPQSGLEKALSMLEEDMQATAPELRLRTKYVVVVLSSGIPSIRCSGDDARPTYASASNPSDIWADNRSPLCNAPLVGTCNPSTWLDGAGVECIPGFTPGGERNQNHQLTELADRIVGLKQTYGVGDVRLHTRLVFNGNSMASCGPLCSDFFWPWSGTQARQIGAWTLEQLALHGQGTSADVADPQQLSLSEVDTSELTRFCP